MLPLHAKLLVKPHGDVVFYAAQFAGAIRPESRNPRLSCRLRADRRHQREPGRAATLRRRVRVATENCFKAHDLATPAHAAHERARVRDSKASSTIDRVFQGNAADALFSGKFEEFRHHRFPFPSLGPPSSTLFLRFGRRIPFPSAGGFGTDRRQQPR